MNPNWSQAVFASLLLSGGDEDEEADSDENGADEDGEGNEEKERGAPRVDNIARRT